ncbi:hypothetical protein B9Z19DRAFT_1102425 [Tuber borchii]|uniref:Uncharacterized protein n=1 Tax=Tuber borchii TaxID=42251 RepID=A0A2T6ZLJ0_TUBBO|nr:hypothetical protein B9Z19DRAFT_1102425 [Tuber borchii]
MLSAISRRIRTPGCQLTTASPIRVRPFTARQSNEQPNERSNEQPNERSNEQPNERSNERSAVTMRRPIVRRTMLPIRGAGQIPPGDVIACILEGEMDQILMGHTRYLYRKFFFNEATRYVWLYVKRPVAKLSYVAEIGSCKLVPHELDMLPYYTNKRMEALEEAKAANIIRMIDREVGEGTVDENIGALPRMTYYAGDFTKFDAPDNMAYTWGYLRGDVGKGVLTGPAASEIYQCPGADVVILAA